MATNYQRGMRLERLAKQDLEDNGYYVIASKGSKGTLDAVAVKPGDLLFISCKLNGQAPPEERKAVYDLASNVGAIPLIAYKRVGSSTVWYWQLTGHGPKDRVPFLLDEVAGEDG